MLRVENEKDKLVIAEKLPNRFDKIQINKNQKDSYELFLNQGIYDAVDYFFEAFSNKVNRKVECVVSIDKSALKGREYRELKGNPPKNYIVKGRVSVDGQEIDRDFVICKIPYSDQYSVLNVDGVRKVLIGELRSMEDISFERKKTYLKVNLVLAKGQIEIRIKSDKAVIVHNKKEYLASDIIEAMLYKENAGFRVSDLFTNAFILKTMQNPDYVPQSRIFDTVDKYNVLGIYDRPIGKLRDSLNFLLTMDNAMNEVLAEDVYLPIDEETMKAGTRLYADEIKTLKRNNIHVIYIESQTLMSGSYLYNDHHIESIRSGTKVSDIIVQLVPEYEGMRYVPYDTHVDYILPNGVQLTPDLIDLIRSSGAKSFTVVMSKTSTNVITVPFKHEIVTNYHSQPKDLFGVMKSATHFSGITDIYTFQQDITEPEYIDKKPVNRLTAFDLAAVISYACRIYSGGLEDTFNRDKDFLKKINLANETLYATLCKAFDTQLYQYSDVMIKTLNRLVVQPNAEVNEPFSGITSSWMSILNTSKLLRAEEDVNPVSLLSQITRVASIVGSRSVSDDQRTLALPFYGRICPYETPQGKQIGLVNHIAIGCDIQNSVPTTHYYPVLLDGNKAYVDFNQSSVVSLSPKEELNGCRIGDLMSLEFEEDGKTIKNTKVIARIPASGESDERMTVATVDSHSLTHVNVLPEQHLSPATMMIPFAGSDDGARITFGISLLKHSVYLLDSQVPQVVTSMYKDIYEYMGYYTKRAPKSGEVVDISTNCLVVVFDGEKRETEIEVRESRVSNNSITTLNYRVGKGERFEKGDILVDSSISREGYFSPARNCFVAYISDDGWNYEDAVVVSEDTAHNFTSLSVAVCTHPIKEQRSGSVSRTTKALSDKLYKYIHKGGTIAEVHSSRAGEATTANNILAVASKESGILYELNFEEDARKKTRNLHYTLVNFNKLRVADKLSGRHGNKGVVSITRKNSDMPQFLNGKHLDMCLNPCGVVSRMNVGQILEAHLGFVGYLLDLRFQTDSFNGASTEEVRMLVSFVYDVAHGMTDEELQATYGKKIPTFVYEQASLRREFIRDWEGCFYRDGSADLYNPDTGKLFANRIVFGYSYMVKTTELVDDKLHGRAGSLDGSPYNAMYKQPTQGSSAGGGQRIGEMEAAAIAAHGATAVLDEMFNLKSDNLPQRVNFALGLLDQPAEFSKEEELPHTVDILRYYLEGMGVGTITDAFPSIEAKDVPNRRDFDFRVMRKRSNTIVESTDKEKVKSMEDMLRNAEDLD